MALYRDPILQHILPELLHAHDNSDGTARSRSGFTFPPHLVRRHMNIYT